MVKKLSLSNRFMCYIVLSENYSITVYLKLFILFFLFQLMNYKLHCTGIRDTMVYIYNSPESENDIRYEYQWEILKTALEKTKAKYGPYKMIKSMVMSEKRQSNELMKATKTLSVMYLDTKPEFEKKLIGIHIPVDKNLSGYRIFLIRKVNKINFYKNLTIKQLKKFTYGLRSEWIDVAILQYNGFKVVTGSNYEGLFEMLVNKRFDVFLRSSTEIFDELEKRKEQFPDLYIEDSLCIFYPLPMYFWFSKTKEGKLLAARAEEGMREMIKDGTYNLIFDKYHRYKIEKLNLKNRKIYRIKNPFLVPETPFNIKKFWFDPHTYNPVKRKK